MNGKFLACIGIIMLTSCTLRASENAPTPTATLVVIPSATSTALTINAPGVSTPTLTGFTPGATLPPSPNPTTFCTDPQVIASIDSLKASMLTSNGAVLSALVHPTRGMDVRYFRDGKVINYSREQAKFLFETTFEADWGNEPGSGLPKKGAFHDVVVPKLVEIFKQTYTLHCNDLKHGGATYELTWPYQGNYYSIYFPGTQEFSGLDWHTWVVGIESVEGKPVIYALMQFFWEP